MRGCFFGFAGIILALLGLFMTLAAEYAFHPPPVPSISITINNVHLFPIRKTPEPPSSHRRFQIAGVIVGAAALVLATVSFLRREPRRWTFTAVAIAIYAIAWTTVVIVLAVVTFILFLSGVLFAGFIDRKSTTPP